MSIRTRKLYMRNLNIAAMATMLGILAASLIPFVILAPYCAPVADDFGYGAPVYYALRTGAGFSGVFDAVAESVRYTYQNWQGTFSSIILFSVQPSAFADRLYVITPFFMLAAIISPIFIATSALHGIRRTSRLFIGSVVALLSVQYMPSPADGIFWWNGAAHYIVFWCLAVLTAILQIKIFRSKKTGAAFYATLAIKCLLAFFTGGGNYSTALVLSMISCVITLYTVLKRHSRRVVIANALITTFSAIALLISIAAPGNDVRQAGFERVGAICAIGLSFKQAAALIWHMTDAKIIGSLILCATIFASSTRKCNFRFQHPFAVLFASFCAFAALYTPPIYAMGTSEIPRIENIFWLAYLFFIFGNTFYIAGWIFTQFRKTRMLPLQYMPMVICTVSAVLFFAALISQFNASNYYMAYSDLQSGSPAVYCLERAERNMIFKDKSITFPRFRPISKYPKCFHTSQFLTWSSDIIVNGVPTELLCYHACGGEITFVAMEQMLELFDRSEELSLSDFSKSFRVGGEDCVPLRELCNMLGFEVIYNLPCDTVEIRTQY